MSAAEEPSQDRTAEAEQVPQPMRGSVGAPDYGPRNLARDRQNPDMLAPPDTDSGELPNLKFSFSDAHNRLQEGGWAREVTARELPIATTLAGVNMRLTPGGVREMHWHKEAEWAFMLDGRARIFAVVQDGRNFTDDVGVGDLWYFPSGIPHALQGLEDCEFLLVFDDGHFSENSTFSLTDWFAHTPKDVLSANFGVPKSAFGDIPSGERYIYQGEVPGPLLTQEASDPDTGATRESFSHRMLEQEPIRTSGGQVRITDSTNFPVSSTIAAALVEVEPGGLREMHWHPNNDEWLYFIEGKGRMTVFASSGTARTFNYQAGDVGYVPFAMGHYIQNTAEEPLRFLEMFKSERFAEVSLNQLMALTPPEFVQEHLQDVEGELIGALHEEKRPVVK
jgi:oxalate decarboxylase